MLWITVSTGIAFLLVAGAVAWVWSQPKPVYRPGKDLEGITSELTRAIPRDHPRVVFTDVARQAGLDLRHFSGARTSRLPEDMGSGAAWGDYDGDGWLDLVIANEVGPLSMSDAERARSSARLRLYRNDRDGSFTDVTDRAGLDVRGWLMGVAWGDYDNDGHADLAITSYGTNHLFRNNGNGSFADRGVAARIAGPPGFWTGASWGDYDRDGFLDLYITGYVRFTAPDSLAHTGKYDVENPASINPSSFRPERNLLYHNNRDGTFSEVARAAGVMDTLGRGLAAAWVDLDEDGLPDLYVANDVSDNVLYRNLGNGRFADVSHAARVADYRSAMGIGVGDWDRDGDQDLFLTHWLAQENALYSNQHAQRAAAGLVNKSLPLVFMDEADRFGLGQSSLDFVGWGTSFVDYDNDGWLDLFVVNGSTLQVRGDSTRLVPMRNQLFWNRGVVEGFVEVGPVAGAALRETHVGRGAAFADYDNDGDVDVLVVNHGGPVQLLRNDGGNRNRWLAVEVRGTKSNRQGIGATITVVAAGRRDRRQVGAQSSYLSQNSLVETFGLGGVTRVDSVLVTWPSGTTDVMAGVESNQRVVVTEGRGGGSGRSRVQAFWTLHREATALRTAGHTTRAAAAYERALELDPDHEDVLYYAGGMRLILGDFAGAARAWRHLVRVNASSARAHSQLGRLHLCLAAGAPFQLDSAAWHLQRAHELNREESGPLLRLGEVALFRGDHAAARGYFETVLASNAGSGVAHFHLGYLAWTAGHVQRARDHHARSRSAGGARPPTPLVGEGDTRPGAAAPQSADARCDAWRTHAADQGDMDSAYAGVERMLRRAREGAARVPGAGRVRP